MTGFSGGCDAFQVPLLGEDDSRAGDARPVLDGHRRALAGDHEPLAAVLPSAQNAAENSTPGRERDRALDRLEQFHADGRRLSDPEAARLLIAVTTATRDALWEDMSRENTSSHIALWTDLTRRAPDEVRAAPAALLGFSSWLNGDGARAWCALDQVPADQPYPLAAGRDRRLPTRDAVGPRRVYLKVVSEAGERSLP